VELDLLRLNGYGMSVSPEDRATQACDSTSCRPERRGWWLYIGEGRNFSRLFPFYAGSPNAINASLKLEEPEIRIPGMSAPDILDPNL